MNIKRVKLNYKPVAKRNKLKQCVYPYDYQNVIVRKRVK